MKTILFLALVALVAWMAYCRERIFVRDPKASVYRDKVKQEGIAVYINYANDVLVEDGANRIVLQRWDKMPGTPVSLSCLDRVACLTGADHAPTLPLEWKGKGAYDPKVTMGDRTITFVDVNGATVQVEL
jgi:hypothetical protein